MRLVWTALVALLPAAGATQQVQFGIEAGVPVTQFLSAFPPNRFDTYVPHTGRYIAGVTTEARLTRRVSVGVEALFRHGSYDNGGFQPCCADFASHTNVRDWEFPVLARYHLRAERRVSVFVTAGAAVDWLQHMKQVTVVSYYYGGSSVSDNSQPVELSQRVVAGIVAGGGVDAHLHRVHLEPEFRYTFWTQRHFGASESSNYGLFSNRNQAEVLLEIKF